MQSQLRFLSTLILAVLLAACSNQPQVTEAPAPSQLPSSTQPPEPQSTAATTPDPASDAQPEDSGEPFPAAVTAQGEILYLAGQLLGQAGQPISGARIEIWQTDASGDYDHPRDPSTADRDLGFQFFGVSATDAEGHWSFRTILPGQYEPRPPHIHFKVKLNGETLLTSQFYFGQADNPNLLVPLDRNQAGRWQGDFTLVVKLGNEGDLTLTPSQQQGPYYPVLDFSEFDNDLASIR